ncbi:MAG: lipopolysaccharide transport periplasmic protein LptA [Gammaproteobacteria bacterium]|nr:lipopolysaccharide transport periplasmic protein LptA [Gammaproteobacteria bacterium]
MWWGVVLASILSGPALALSTDKDQPVNIEADWAEADDLKRVTVYKGRVVVVQGSLRITGDVVTMYFDEQDELTKMIAVGRLARFQQRPDGQDILQRGKATRIVYNQQNDLLTLTGTAQLAKGDDEINADFITYDTVKSVITGDSRQAKTADGKPAKPSGRVRITIKPKPKN